MPPKEIRTAGGAGRTSEDPAARMLDLARALAAATGRDEIAQELARAAPAVVGAARSLVYLWDGATETLEARGAHGYPPGLEREVRGLVLRTTDSPLIERGLAGPTTTYWNLDDIEDAAIAERMRAFNAQEALTVPIIARDELVGLVAVSRQPDQAALRVDERSLDLIRGFADLAATAFQNVRLLEQEGTTIKRLRETNRFKSEFVGVASHELRTPLAAIMGMARTIVARGDQLEEKVKLDFLRAIVERGEQLERLVEDLLQSSREVDLRPAPTDMAQIIHSAVEEARQLARERSIASDVPARLPLIADGGRLRQVLDNLMTNAMKYAPSGEIRVEASRRGEDIVFSVADNGTGMTGEEVERAFQAFYQGGTITDGMTRGVGLGLYISRRIVEAHGGAIAIDSRKGRGTKVTVTVPARGLHIDE